MITLKLKQCDEVVFYLSSNGFVRGFIKAVVVDQRSLKFYYRVSCAANHKEYQGDQKEPDEIWDTYEDMLKHFTKKGLS